MHCSRDSSAAPVVRFTRGNVDAKRRRRATKCDRHAVEIGAAANTILSAGDGSRFAELVICHRNSMDDVTPH
jgi:hypothetical protein